MKTPVTLLCATTNPQKFENGRNSFAKHGMVLEQVVIDIDEIQGEDPHPILLDKARKAFAIVQKPVLVSDDTWDIPALNGFPGAYMKSINHWFEPEDIINLVRDKKDKTIHIDQNLAYIDDSEIVTFTKRLSGVIVDEPRGNSGPPIMRVVELEGDGMTIAELYDKGLAIEHGDGRGAWKEAADWYAERMGNR